MKSIITWLLLAGSLACGCASAQVTRFVVPFAAGGGTDVYARLVAAEISRAGMQVIVENKVGATGNIASEYVAKSRPDGLTVLIHSQPLIYNTVLFEKLSYDPMKDFVPVSHIGYQDIILVGRPDLPYGNVKEMVAYAKANPGKINRGSPGAGTSLNFVPLLFERVAGIGATHVPFNGDAPALQALLGGVLDIHGTTITGPLQHIQSGKLRVLGVAGNKRLPQAPNAPTFKESGFDVVADAWFVMVAPVGTPRDAIDRLNKAVNQALAREEFIAKARAMGIEPRGGSPDELGKFLRAENDRWVPLLNSLNLPKN